MPTERRIRVRDGVELAAVVYGNPNEADAKTQRWLLLHGWLDNAATFEPLARLMDDCVIVAVDLTGHGKSDHAAGGSYHLVDYAADAVAAQLRLMMTVECSKA